MTCARFRERREDTSCTTRVRFDEHGCQVLGPEVRASVHERRREPDGRGWRVSASPGQGSVEAVTPEPSWRSPVTGWQAVAAGLVCRITTTRMHRSYRNSEGVAFGRFWIWSSVDVACARSGARVSDGVEDPAGIADTLRSCAEELRDAGAWVRPRMVLDASQQVSVLLPPTEAGALFHELLGHGAEEGWHGLAVGTRVGPASMRVVARHPWSAFCDDEGVRTAEVALVAGGRLLRLGVTDRASARGRDEPVGLAVAGIHGELPRARCVHMRVQGGGERVDGVLRDAGRVVRCAGLIGAEFHGGVALVMVRGGELVQDGEATGARVGPFAFRVALDELADRLVALPGEIVLARAGQCTRARDPVRTHNQAPHALLAGVRVRALPEI